MYFNSVHDWTGTERIKETCQNNHWTQFVYYCISDAQNIINRNKNSHFHQSFTRTFRLECSDQSVFVGAHHILGIFSEEIKSSAMQITGTLIIPEGRSTNLLNQQFCIKCQIKHIAFLGGVISEEVCVWRSMTDDTDSSFIGKFQAWGQQIPPSTSGPHASSPSQWRIRWESFAERC